MPSTAVSGVYIAHLVRNDGDGDSQIIFVVRDDAGTSKLLLQTSDASWQAYNSYGGNNLYDCVTDCPDGIVRPTVQEEIASPLLRTDTSPWTPPCQAFDTV